MEGKIYNIKNSKLIILSAREFQSIVEREQIYSLENKITLEIKKIENECNLVKCCLSSFPVKGTSRDIFNWNLYSWYLIPDCSETKMLDVSKIKHLLNTGDKVCQL